MAKYLSKSKYVSGVGCAKTVWMSANKKEEFDPRWLDTAKMGMGTEIGELARGYYGDYELVKGSFRYLERMAEKTLRLIEEGHRTICEATFVAEGCVCLVDILRVLPDRVLEVVEVKSSTKVKPEHLLDTSFQAAVVAAAMPGWDLRRVSLMHVDPKYVRHGDVDIHQLFEVEDVTEKLQDPKEVMATARRLMAVASGAEEPPTRIGKHCNSPHACPYQTYCMRCAGLDDSICELAGRGRARGFELMARGITTYEQALGSLDLKGLALTQAGVMSTGADEYVDAGELKAFLGQLHYPLYFLDFETVQSGIPLWDNLSPYAQVTSQWSIHWLDEEGGELHHAEYLAPCEGDPRRGVAEALVAAIPEGACVTAYNMSFERGRIREMADAFPLLATRLMGIHDSIVDLMVPFQRGWVYRREMGGSYSIKHVLPAMCPDDPALDYHALDGVHCGTEATAAFLRLSKLPPEEQAEVREQLLRYCELDTLAMVRVWEKLTELAG